MVILILLDIVGQMHYDVSDRFNFRCVPRSGLEQTFAKISQEHEDDEDDGYIRFLI